MVYKDHMKPTSTLFLRIILVGMTLIGLGIAVLLSTALTNASNRDYLPMAIGMYLAAVPYFMALFQANKLLTIIDRNQAFSAASVNALKNIKYCAIAVSVIFAALLPYMFMLADGDDAPGVFVLAIIGTGAPMVLAVFTAVLQKLLQNAIDIKAENDLTV